MRSLSNYNDNSTGVDDAGLLIVIFMFAVVISITCCVTCPGEGLCAIGVIKIFLTIIMMFSPHYVGPDGEVQVTGSLLNIFVGIIWIIVGQHKIDNRRRIQREEQEEVAEQRIPTPHSGFTYEDYSPVAIAVRHDNSGPPAARDMRKTRQGRGNYHEIIVREELPEESDAMIAIRARQLKRDVELGFIA
jgi:hypothetical protein